MTSDDLRYFQTADGRALLRAAAETPGDDLAVLTRLRKAHPPERCRAVVHLLTLRERATSKFSRAYKMVFDREGLEQSSGETIAAYRAKRYRKFDRVTDLCCGIGGDALALAEHARVFAVDINPNRLALTRWNARVYNRAVHPVCADAETWLPKTEAIFFDPARRENDRRLFALADYHPPVDLDRLRAVTPHMGIKVAPGLPEADIPPGCEVEFISEFSACKEAVLWFGDLRTRAVRRATLLPGEHTLVQRPVAEAPVRPPGAYIAEPDRAVVRAHLIDQLAADLDAWKLAPDVAYLSADHPLESPFVRSYAVTDVLPFNLKRLQRYLAAHAIGRLDIKKRHFPLTPEALRKRLKLKGPNRAILFLTRIDAYPTVIVCRPPHETQLSHMRAT